MVAELTFDGDTDRQCVNVTVNPDVLVEGTESFALVLNSDESVILQLEEATIQIVDSASRITHVLQLPVFSLTPYVHLRYQSYRKPTSLQCMTLHF